MRILHILAQLPARTGSGVYFQNLIREWQAYPHEQRAVFAVQAGEAFDFLAPNQQYPVAFCTETLPFPIAGMSDVMPYANTVYGEMDAEMLRRWRAAFRAVLERAQAEFQPQVVILHHLWLLSALAVDVFPAAVKIGVCHNTDLRQAVQHPALLGQAASLRQLDAVFALSEMQKAPIAATYGIAEEKITVLGGGFDQTLFYPAEGKRSTHPIDLVYASKIDAAKGIYALLDACPSIWTECPFVHLHVIGTPDAENAARLQAYVRNDSRITLLPAMPQHELAAFFRSMDVFVLPSFFEGLGLTALEALASGLRVVATENPGLMGLLGDKINTSGVISYVVLPPMETVDRPDARALPDFSRRLAAQILQQVRRIQRGERWPEETMAQLGRYSWAGIAAHANEEILRLARRPTGTWNKL